MFFIHVTYLLHNFPTMVIILYVRTIIAVQFKDDFIFHFLYEFITDLIFFLINF